MSWIPQGRHEVQIGPSLNKALKARRGAAPPPAKRTGPPEKDFYSFRYNFKPPTVDSTKPGTIELTRGQDATNVSVEHPSTQPGETLVYTGTESRKEFDCVLIYDEETGSYKLEKLESYIVLTYGGKGTTTLPPSAAPTPPKVEDDPRISLIDAEGESDDELPSHFTVLREEEEEDEEDGELEPVPLPPTRPAKTAPPPKPAALPVPRALSPPMPPSRHRPVPQRKPTKKMPPPPPPPADDADADGDAEEEDLEFGRPATKRRKRTPPVALSLPGSGAGAWVPPPAPVAPPLAPRAPSPVPSDSDEDGWDPVPVEPQDIEIDMNEFEQTLAAEMDLAEADDDEDADGDGDGSEPEDFLADALPQAPDSAATPVRPMSMGQLAGYSDDEYSSSDDSDDD
ncbi:RNA polymerase II transcription elongation factor-domain-containing protein [Mycena belliarum]|uniref:RNA polymerase II transcription elongation factor-domain-containing protein n=1 Tax=Mycena belliarum TaxID=1033014 RepID=A0AAD6XQH5_9AGAR|nr:RNA polymerase II transcription elongation factor-domain-containing protein [Mycena belliae]